MIGFVLVGTNDLNRAMCFYNEICASLGAKRLYQMTNGCVGVVYGAESGPMLGVVQPFDGQPAKDGISCAATKRKFTEPGLSLAHGFSGTDLRQ